METLYIYTIRVKIARSNNRPIVNTFEFNILNSFPVQKFDYIATSQLRISPNVKNFANSLVRKYETLGRQML